MDFAEWLEPHDPGLVYVFVKPLSSDPSRHVLTLGFDTAPPGDDAGAVEANPVAGFPTLAVVRPRERGAGFLAPLLFPGRPTVLLHEVFTPETDAERYALPDRLSKLLRGDAAVVAVGLGVHTAWLSERLPEGRTLAVVLDAEEVRRVAGAAAAITADGTAEIVGIRWARVDLVLVGSEEDRATFVAAFESAGADGPGEVRVGMAWRRIGG